MESMRLGMVAHRAGQFEVAERHYRAVLAMSPDHPEAVRLMGVLLAQRGEAGATAWLERAIALNPSEPSTHFNLAMLLFGAGQLERSLVCVGQTLLRNPNHGDAWMLRARALAGLNRPPEALDAYEHVLALRFNLDALIGKSVMLHMMRRGTEAIDVLRQAAVHAPGNAALHMGLGDMLVAEKQFMEAVAAYDRAHALEPDRPLLLGNRYYAKSCLCDWRGWETDRDELLAAVEAGKPVASSLIKLEATPAQQQACARLFADRAYPHVPPLWQGERYDNKRLRIAYVSTVLRHHASGILAIDMFEQHDRDQFEFFAIAAGPDDDSILRRRLEKSFEHFLPVAHLDDRAIAQRIRDLEIDIAVDFDGGIVQARPGIFAHRPAPLAVAFLGYPGTMGTPHIDALIADRITVPQSDFPFFDETVVWMPDSYQPNSVRPMSPEVPSRSDAGLPEKGFVFCCFNEAHKVTPRLFAIWMRLLAQVPGSVLWLLTGLEAARANLRREAEALGIEPARLVFAAPADLPRHLARHALADLFLDTLPYNAHTTASDALWCGLPVVTAIGHAFPGRVAASLLQAAGLADLVAADLAGYETLALDLAHDPQRLNELRARLARNRDTGPLFDAARFAKNIESVYRDLWRQRWEAP